MGTLQVKTKTVSVLLLLLLNVGCFKAPNNDTVVSKGSLVVVMVQDESRQDPLPSGVVIAMGAKDVQEYLDAKCAKGADGKTPEAKKYHKLTDVSSQSKAVQEVHAAVVGKMDASKDPYIGIKHGRRIAVGKVPPGKDDMLNLLRKYGGK